MNVRSIDNAELATTPAEYRKLVESDADWIVRSADDVWEVREAGYGPLAKLPEVDLRAFVATLEFKDGGVVTGSYRPLVATLTLTDIFEVFGYFGWSRELFLRDLEYSCNLSSGSCQFDFWYFCSPEFCSPPGP